MLVLTKIPKIEIPVLSTAFQIELDSSQFILVYSTDEDDIYTMICYWTHEEQFLENPFTNENALPKGRVLGWSKIPYYDPEL
jgi:hypothetical protein